jgi:hypothetical protein
LNAELAEFAEKDIFFLSGLGALCVPYPPDTGGRNAISSPSPTT